MPPTISQMATALSQGETTSVQLLENCLARIKQLEPSIKAWVFVQEEQARRQAEAIDVELRQGKSRGPLHGIPLGIKDIFDVYDWPTAAGSRLWKNSVARHDSTVVAKLRQAGAVFIGKTVTTQYASFDPPPTRNPWDASKTPGGSSSGSAAAVASGMCPAAMGSQTGGSITRPASFCGIAGCKPTFGRVSCHGVVPLAPSIDHPGPMARSVRDLAIILQTIAGYDPKDPSSVDRPVPDYLARMKAGWGQPVRLGRLRGIFEDRAEDAANKMMDRVCQELAEKGAKIIDVALPASMGEMERRHRVVMAVEAAAYHQTRFWEHPEDYDPCFTSLLEEGLQCPAPEYARCKEHQKLLSREMQSCFAEVDALVLPGARGPAPDADTTGDPLFNSPWSYTGLPCVSFPADWTPAGLPQAFQLVGPDWSEADLLTLAEWCEQKLEVESREAEAK